MGELGYPRRRRRRERRDKSELVIRSRCLLWFLPLCHKKRAEQSWTRPACLPTRCRRLPLNSLRWVLNFPISWWKGIGLCKHYRSLPAAVRRGQRHNRRHHEHPPPPSLPRPRPPSSAVLLQQTRLSTPWFNGTPCLSRPASLPSSTSSHSRPGPLSSPFPQPGLLRLSWSYSLYTRDNFGASKRGVPTYSSPQRLFRRSTTPVFVANPQLAPVRTRCISRRPAPPAKPFGHCNSLGSQQGQPD